MASLASSTTTLQGIDFALSSTSLRGLDLLPSSSSLIGMNHIRSAGNGSHCCSDMRREESVASIGLDLEPVASGNGFNFNTVPTGRDLITPPVMAQAQCPPPLSPRFGCNFDDKDFHPDLRATTASSFGLFVAACGDDIDTNSATGC